MSFFKIGCHVSGDEVVDVLRSLFRDQNNRDDVFDFSTHVTIGVNIFAWQPSTSGQLPDEHATLTLAVTMLAEQ